MASHQQTRIQAYLERNKIGPLFEELMTKLITETPDQPIPFLIDHLQSKQGNRSQLQRTLSGSAALWAESETSENKGTRRDFRSYDKPWQVNAKKPKKSKSDLAVSNISPPSPESKSCIAISDELDKDTTSFNAPLLRPRVIGEWIGREENDADPLAAEMLQPPIPRSKNEQWDSEDSNSSPGGSLKMEPKTKGLKQQQQQHKKLLAAMLSQDSFDSVQSTAPSVTEEDIDNEDDAMELLEDLDDLRMEGVTSLMSSGSKFNQTRSAHPVEPQAKVTLNICARCARLQGDNLAEQAEDVSLVSLAPEQTLLDSDASVPGVETQMEDTNDFESASQVMGPHQPAWDLDILCIRNGGSPSQKLLKDSLAAKELQTMEKHLADIEKDLALWEEARLSRSPSSQPTSLVTSDHQGNRQATPSQNSRPQVPTQPGKNIQLQLQGNKSPPLPNNSRTQVCSISNSRPQTPNMQTNRHPTPSTGNRPVTPNSLLSRPLTPSNQENKEGIISMQRNRSLTSKSQMGRTLGTPSGLAVQMSGDIVGTVTQRSSISEDEFLQQLQLVHQPWILPSDTESEGVEADQDKFAWGLRLAVPNLFISEEKHKYKIQ
ncbi:PREDICTED: uncharacterized protein C8orf34 homolog isoform X4 [Gavialis gangeticus]|uniref:uncharacterized protein C8orf34 homolog isoform X4 n=1 Tax=Gavialis gangeticus TaxID=94835 RepID=UPI00092F3033|nr:PREDICTED: uncharacterized protein C8orf34 homolog isoform X4 [Gavialis gangeticus]